MLVGVVVFLGLGQAGVGNDVIYQILTEANLSCEYAVAISKAITGCIAILASGLLTLGYLDFSCGKVVSSEQFGVAIKMVEGKRNVPVIPVPCKGKSDDA